MRAVDICGQCGLAIHQCLHLFVCSVVCHFGHFWGLQIYSQSLKEEMLATVFVSLGLCIQELACQVFVAEGSRCSCGVHLDPCNVGECQGGCGNVEIIYGGVCRHGGSFGF